MAPVELPAPASSRSGPTHEDAPPAPGVVERGLIHFPDADYTVSNGEVSRGAQQVGTLTTTPPDDNGDEPLSAPLQYIDSRQKLQKTDLLALNLPGLEGSTLQVGQEWWAFACGAWVHLGKPLSHHTYPGFEVSGGGTIVEKIAEWTRPYHVTRRRRHHHRGRRVLVTPAPPVPPADLEMLSRIGDAETSGDVDCVNTYDNGIVSFGLRQWTLSSGRLQNFIRRNAGLFAHYGIVAYPDAGVEKHPDYYWDVKGNPVPRIAGVTRPEDLTSPYWTARFFRAGLDNRIILAEVRQAAYELYRTPEGSFSSLRQAMISSPYVRDCPQARALLAELENNRPNYTMAVLQTTLRDPLAANGVTERQFVQVLMLHIADSYANEFSHTGGGVLLTASRGSLRGRPHMVGDRVKLRGYRFAVGWMARVLHTTPRFIQQFMEQPLAPVPPLASAEKPAERSLTKTASAAVRQFEEKSYANSNSTR